MEKPVSEPERSRPRVTSYYFQFIKLFADFLPDAIASRNSPKLVLCHFAIKHLTVVRVFRPVEQANLIT
jgi:hypothetical protein